jgi:hypothetical protein
MTWRCSGTSRTYTVLGELFGAIAGRKVDAVYVITPFIHARNPDAVVAVANAMGITVVWPRP